MNDIDSIYREFQPKIYRYLSRLSGQTDATDLTQEVFLKVSQALDTFRGESSLATWIYRIATNTAYDHAARDRSNNSFWKFTSMMRIQHSISPALTSRGPIRSLSSKR
jgi:RNA polymerase sigma factor (sigma-70 family)